MQNVSYLKCGDRVVTTQPIGHPLTEHVLSGELGYVTHVCRNEKCCYPGPVVVVEFDNFIENGDEVVDLWTFHPGHCAPGESMDEYLRSCLKIVVDTETGATAPVLSDWEGSAREQTNKNLRDIFG